MAEYGLLIALVVVTVVGFVGLFGDSVLGLFTDVDGKYPENDGSQTTTTTTTTTTGA